MVFTQGHWFAFLIITFGFAALGWVARRTIMKEHPRRSWLSIGSAVASIICAVGMIVTFRFATSLVWVRHEVARQAIVDRYFFFMSTTIPVNGRDVAITSDHGSTWVINESRKHEVTIVKPDNPPFVVGPDTAARYPGRINHLPQDGDESVFDVVLHVRYVR